MAHLEHARACGRWSSGKKYEESGAHPHGTFSLRGEDELVHRYNWEQDLSPHRVGVLSSVELGEGSRGNEGWRVSFQTRGTSWLKPGAEKGKTNLGEESGKWWRYLREATIPIFSATVWAAFWKGVQRESRASVKYRLGVYIVTLAADSKGCLSSHVSLEGGCESTRVRGEPDVQRQVVLRGRDWRGPVA